MVHGFFATFATHKIVWMRKNLLKYMALVLFLCMTTAQANRFVLVIDAGHGGKDAGAVGRFSKEKDINLNVALAFGRLVERNCPDVKVVYTRKTDIFIPLGDRPNIANKAKADLFISIHTNSVESGYGGRGAETYTLTLDKQSTNLEIAKRENSVITLESDYKTRYEGFDPNKAESYVIFEFMQNQFMHQSVDLARCIQQQYKKAGRVDKGVKQANLLVLRNTTMPAVLTELGFISNPDEEQFLNSREGINALATSIYNGFLAYRKRHGGRNLPAPLPTTTSEQQPATTPAPQEAAVVPIETTLPAKQEPATAQPSTASAKPVAKEKPQADAVQPPKEKSEAPVRSTAKSPVKDASATKSDTGTLWRIQFAATSEKTLPDDKRLRSLPDVVTIQDGTLYKHYSGNYRTQAEMRAALAKVREVCPDAFPVKFINGQRQ